MSRVLTCIDPVPAEDGSCVQTAWLELPSWVDVLPTVEQANTVGPAIAGGLILLAAMRLLIPKNREDE
ncbi:hypothetical protein [Xanthomonas sp. XNM01]|uniref:hypothetical protein n=1 Tax=Xanthomonas sp. XNM01 TaxID=2769289 RepID=UPI00177AF59F|nr:hypothetical protein [Xanthomonas sp. XNM01]MBD9368357.1 hypothetical protein [Xanthomonas sp. XNM01]